MVLAALVQASQPLQHFAFERNPMVRIAVIRGNVARLDFFSAQRFNLLDKSGGFLPIPIVHQ